jgi:branched-chain amino acid transport system substrate-binding protein
MKRVLFVVIAVCVGFASFLCGTGYAAEKGPYLIGSVGDMTGRQSNLGVGNKRGMEIAIDAINAAGGVNGRQLKVIYYDSESEASKAVIHTKRLMEADKVVILAGYSSSATAMASVQTAEGGKTPLIASTPADGLWIPTKKWIFNVVPRQREASIPMLLDNLMQRGAKKIAYIYIDTIYGQNGKATFDWAAKEMKFTPAIVEKYAPGSVDLGPQITHIKAAGADGLLSDYAIVSPEFIELAGKYGEGIVTTSLKTLVAPDLPANDPQKKVSVDLYDRYAKLHGPFSLYAGHTWDQAYMIAEGLKKVDPNLDPAKPADLVKVREQLRDNIEKIKGFVGQNGIFNYSPDNHNGLGPKCYVPVVVEKGKWRLYTGGLK